MTVELDELTEGQEFVCARDGNRRFSVQNVHVQSIQAESFPMNLYGYASTATKGCKKAHENTPCPDDCPVKDLLEALDGSGLRTKRS